MVKESFIRRKAKMLQILNETWTKLVGLTFLRKLGKIDKYSRKKGHHLFLNISARGNPEGKWEILLEKLR